MKGIRIALIRRGAFKPDGISRVIECWASMLAELGHSVVVLSEAAPYEKDFSNIPVVTEVQYNAASRGPFSEARVAVERLKQIHQESGLDLVISHDSLVTVEVRRNFPHMPLLGTFHSPLVDENRLNNWKYADGIGRRLKYPATWAALWLTDRNALRAVNHAHTLSEFTWKILSARYTGLCKNLPWHLIPGSFDQRRFKPPADREALRARLRIAPKEKMLLTVRRLVPRNGLDRIIQCASSLKGIFDNLRYVIVGTGPMKELLARKIQDAGVCNFVTLAGFIGEDELPFYYQAADLFLLPTRDLECFGLPVIEAMACGCPPLVMPDGGPAEVCVGHPEWIAEANTDEAFIEQVRSYLLRNRPVAKGIENEALRLYSNDAIRHKILELIGSLC